MISSSAARSGSVAQNEQELKAIYQERNQPVFSTPPKYSNGVLRSFGWTGAGWLLFVMLVSLFTSVIVTSLIQPNTFIPAAELRPRRTLPAITINDQLRNNITGAVVTIFGARGGKVGSIIDQTYLVSESLGQGLVLSSDGWLVTSQAVVSDPRRAYVVSVGGNLYTVNSIVLDPVTPFTYLKVSANNLNTTAFADPALLETNQSVVIGAKNTQSSTISLWERQLVSLTDTTIINRTDLVVSSEFLPDRYLLNESLEKLAVGAPVFTIQGQAIGLVAERAGATNLVLPIDSLGTVLDNLFSMGEVQRSTIGISYIQTSWLQSLAPANLVPNNGALIMGASKHLAVVPKSAAAQAGMQEGDIITAVAGERTHQRSLSALVQQYHPGTKLDFTINRRGKEIKLPVILGKLVNKIIVQSK